jgi:hypothetical protein
VAKRSDKLGALIAALPMVTVLTLIWLAIEKAPQEKIANHAYLPDVLVCTTYPAHVFGLPLAVTQGGVCALAGGQRLANATLLCNDSENCCGFWCSTLV